MNRKPILTAAVFLITALAAFEAGRITRPAKSDVAADEKPAERASRPQRNDAASPQASTRGERPASATTPPAERLARLESIVRGENPYERNRALLAFLDRLAPGDFEGVVDHFRALGITEERLGEYGLILAAWAKVDPLAALAYAKSKTDNPFAARAILTSWATEDSAAAIRWAQNNHQGDGANPWLIGVIRGIAATDIKGATDLLKSMPRSVERGEALDALLPHLLAKGNESTRTWIASIDDDALRSGAMMRAAEAMAKTDPAGTVAWLMENPGEALDRRLDDVFGIWAKQDEAAARSALNTLPTGEIRSDALRGVVTRLALSKPNEAVALMDQYPDEVNDRTVRNFIWHSFGKDPAAALGEVSRIGDENRRNEMYRRAMGAWMRRDATAAKAWLNTNPLPESVTRSLSQDEAR
ncbi:MAG: hypothetical protein ACK49N_05205 [Verrucomicrobiota bacterium]